jgi:hypothetical protein
LINLLGTNVSSDLYITKRHSSFQIRDVAKEI